MRRLTVGLVGEGAPAALRRIDRPSVEHGVLIVEEPDATSHAACQLIVGVGTSNDETARAATDIWLDDVDEVDELWRTRVVPFASNVASGTRAPRRQRAVLFDPDPTWPAQAKRLIARLRFAIEHGVLRMDHIGSTSVPALPAKNLIDIQIVVPDLAAAAAVADAARAAGFVRVSGPLSCLDRHGIAHLEEVVVDADPGRPVNVNIRPVTAPIWRETLLFRDWLRASPDARAEYLAVKRRLADRPGHDVDDYGRDKVPWISAGSAKAETWAAEHNWTP